MPHLYGMSRRISVTGWIPTLYMGQVNSPPPFCNLILQNGSWYLEATILMAMSPLTSFNSSNNLKSKSILLNCSIKNSSENKTFYNFTTTRFLDFLNQKTISYCKNLIVPETGIFSFVKFIFEILALRPGRSGHLFYHLGKHSPPLLQSYLQRGSQHIKTIL